MSTYTAIVERDQPYWLITVPEVDRSTQARHLREVETMARDLVAVMEDVEPDSFELAIRVKLPAEVEVRLTHAEQLREQSAKANREAAEESRRAARDLRDLGLTVRDVGDALGVSHQRAHQLVNG